MRSADEIRDSIKEGIYSGERLEDVPSIGDLEIISEKVADYMDDYEYGDLEYELGSELYSKVIFEKEDREKKRLRLDEVPEHEDLSRIRNKADLNLLNEKRARRRMSDEKREELEPIVHTEANDVKYLSDKELTLRRTHQLHSLLETAHQGFSAENVNPAQIREDDDGILYMWIGSDSIEGVKYSENTGIEPEDGIYVKSLAEEITKLVEAEPEEIGKLGGITSMDFLNTAFKFADYKEARGDEFERNDFTGVSKDDIGETREIVMKRSREALEELDRRGVTYFEIEGYNLEEISSLVNRVRIRDNFEHIEYDSMEETEPNREAWENYTKRVILEDSDENNALRLFYDEE